MTEVEILLVEDNPGDVRLTQEALRGAKFPNQVNAVPDGVTALDYLFQREDYSTSKRPDLVLLDLNLPKVSGHEVLKTIKRDTDLANIPVVILSSSKADRDVMRSFNLNANGYIAKPLDFDGFKDMVGEIEKLWFSMERRAGG